MKIIDLFYKIMTDEKVPQKIKYHNKIWELDTNKINGYFDYINCDNRGMTVFFANYLYSNPNDTVEILEEEKKIPEKLDDFTIAVGKVAESNIEEYIQTLFNQQYEIFNKINSIIDYLKSKGE